MQTLRIYQYWTWNCGKSVKISSTLILFYKNPAYKNAKASTHSLSAPRHPLLEGSLVPAVALIPAPRAYMKVDMVKNLVVGSRQSEGGPVALSFSFATILPLEPKCFVFTEASCRVYKKNVGRSLAGIVYG